MRGERNKINTLLEEKDERVANLIQSLYTKPFEANNSIDEEDLSIIDLVEKLFNETINMSAFDSNDSSDNEFKLNCDEFTQIGMQKCIKLCMNFPGKNIFWTSHLKILT